MLFLNLFSCSGPKFNPGIAYFIQGDGNWSGTEMGTMPFMFWKTK